MDADLEQEAGAAGYPAHLLLFSHALAPETGTVTFVLDAVTVIIAMFAVAAHVLQRSWEPRVLRHFTIQVV